jgi:hypothetical protein
LIKCHAPNISDQEAAEIFAWVGGYPQDLISVSTEYAALNKHAQVGVSAEGVTGELTSVTIQDLVNPRLMKLRTHLNEIFSEAKRDSLSRIEEPSAVGDVGEEDEPDSLNGQRTELAPFSAAFGLSLTL